MVHGARALNQALGVLRGKDWSLSEVGWVVVGGCLGGGAVVSVCGEEGLSKVGCAVVGVSWGKGCAVAGRLYCIFLTIQSH